MPRARVTPEGDIDRAINNFVLNNGRPADVKEFDRKITEWKPELNEGFKNRMRERMNIPAVSVGQANLARRQDVGRELEKLKHGGTVAEIAPRIERYTYLAYQHDARTGIKKFVYARRQVEGNMVFYYAKNGKYAVPVVSRKR